MTPLSDRLIAALAASTILLGAVACANPPAPAAPPASTPSPPSPVSPATSPSIATVPEVLDFEAPLLGGGVFRGADHVGKDLALWFWAPW